MTTEANQIKQPAKIEPTRWLTSSTVDMQAKLLRGEQIDLAKYLATHRGMCSTEPTIDLLYAEYMVRKSMGLSVDREELCARYPEHAASLRRQFDLDDALADADLEIESPALLRAKAVKAADEAPSQIGKYTVIASLGKGLQATAYRVVHPDLQVEAVIKIAHANAPGNAENIADEARTLARLDHAHLVKVFDAGVHEGRPYLVSEYVAGQTLELWVRHRAMDPVEAARMVAKLGRGVQVAHDNGVCHLDVKPSNIVVDRAGEPKVIDFGLSLRREANVAECDEPSTIRGTLEYMPPEQARGDFGAIGPRSDIFSLGGVLFYLLTRKSPVLAPTIREGYHRALHCQWQKELLDAAAIPPQLKRICCRAMQGLPEERYASAADLAADLERFVAGFAQHRTRRRLIIGGLTAAALLTAVTALVWLRPPAKTHLPTPCVKIAVWDAAQKTFVQLQSAWPLRYGDKVRVEAATPPDRYATLFQYSEGKWHRLASSEANTAAVLNNVEYPSPDARQATEIVGSPGTDLLVVVSHRHRPPKVIDLPPLPKTLPAIPPDNVIRINGAGSEISTIASTERVKGFGHTVAVANALAIVEQRLEVWRAKLPRDFEFIEALAYYHGE